MLQPTSNDVFQNFKWSLSGYNIPSVWPLFCCRHQAWPTYWQLKFPDFWAVSQMPCSLVCPNPTIYCPYTKSSNWPFFAHTVWKGSHPYILVIYLSVQIIFIKLCHTCYIRDKHKLLRELSELLSLGLDVG